MHEALLATLLLAEYTGVAASRRTCKLVTSYLQGWVSPEEFLRVLDRIGGRF